LTPQSTLLEVPHASLWFDVLGEGPVVIAAHGMLSSCEVDQRLGFNWSPIASAGRCLVRYDARGHGRSTGRPRPDDYTWPSLATDMLALRAHVAGTAPVDALGASMGCGTLLHAAVRHPEAFRRLVLVIPPTAWATRAAQATGYRAAADLVEARGIGPFLAAFKAQPLPPVLREDPSIEFSPSIPESLLPAALRGAALSDLPALEELATLRQPTLVLAWRDDPMHPEVTATSLARTLPDARLVIASNLPSVRAWVQRVLEFLAAP
jgi:3-oxoadipate enol-lactonase